MDTKLGNSLGASSDAKTPGFSICNRATVVKAKVEEPGKVFKPLRESTAAKKARLDYEKKKTEKKISDMSSAFGFE